MGISVCTFWWRSVMIGVKQSNQHLVDLIAEYASKIFVEYTWVHADTSRKPSTCGVGLQPDVDILSLKKAVANLHGVPHDELFVVNVRKAEIHRELRGAYIVGDIMENTENMFVYHSPKPDLSRFMMNGTESIAQYSDKQSVLIFKRTAEDEDLGTFILQFQHRAVRRPHYGAEQYMDKAFGYPRCSRYL